LQSTLHGQVYELASFNFHSPSEHTVAGKAFPLEMQLTHTSPRNSAMVSVLFELGAENEFLNSLHWDELPPAGGKATVDKLLNVAQVLPFDLNYWHYQGSLTEPPCTEGTLWYILQQPVMLSQKQLDRLTSTLKMQNNRPIQPLNSRKIFDSRITPNKCFGAQSAPQGTRAEPIPYHDVMVDNAYTTPEIREAPVPVSDIPVSIVHLGPPITPVAPQQMVAPAMYGLKQAEPLLIRSQ